MNLLELFIMCGMLINMYENGIPKEGMRAADGARIMYAELVTDVMH